MQTYTHLSTKKINQTVGLEGDVSSKSDSLHKRISPNESTRVDESWVSVMALSRDLAGGSHFGYLFGPTAIFDLFSGVPGGSLVNLCAREIPLGLLVSRTFP